MSWIYRLQGQQPLREADDALLRKLIERHVLAGTEMIRDANSASSWAPLWTLPIYREVLGLAPQDDAEKIAKLRARGKVLPALVGMAIVFLTSAVSAAMTAHGSQAGPNLAPLYLALTAGSISAAGMVGYVLARRKQDLLKKKSEMQSEVQRALAGLQSALVTAPPDIRASVDIEALARNADSTQRASKSLAAFASVPREPIVTELDEARKRAAAEPGVAAYQERVSALEAHLKNLDEMKAAAADAEARERALMHEIEALHLALTRAAIDSTKPEALLDRLRDLRTRLDEESRIANELDETARSRAASMGSVAAR